jgi:hypothetical protein
MKLNLNHHLSLLTLAGLLASAAQPLPAQSVLLNGSFETQGGSFNNWNVNSPAGSLVIDSPTGNYLNAFQSSTPDGGSYYALFTASAINSTLDQAFATTPGTRYDINFYVNDPYGNSSLTVNAGSSALLNIPNGYTALDGLGWVDFNYTYQATGPSTDLNFAGLSGSFLGVDAVTVTTVPEPGTLALAGVLAVGLALLRYRRVA